MYRRRIAHIQVAGVPGCHEPDQLGEVNFRYIFDLLDGLGYDGWVACIHSTGETRPDCVGPYHGFDASDSG